MERGGSEWMWIAIQHWAAAMHAHLNGTPLWYERIQMGRADAKARERR